MEKNSKNDAKFETVFVSFGRRLDWQILGPSNATKEGKLTAEHPTKEQQHQQRGNTPNRTPSRPGAYGPERIFGDFWMDFGTQNGIKHQ